MDVNKPEESENERFKTIGLNIAKDYQQEQEQKLEKEIKTLQGQPANTKIADAEELKTLKKLLKYKIGIPFCTNVLRVALNMKEIKIAR